MPRNVLRDTRLGARRSLVLAVLFGAVALALASVAAADTVRATSEPNGELSLIVSTGDHGTNRDGDGDFSTTTHGDRVGANYFVLNTTDQSQTIEVTYTLDAPGTALDEQITEQESVEPDGQFSRWRELFQVHKKQTPAGTYAVTVTASGSESVTGTATFTVSFD